MQYTHTQSKGKTAICRMVVGVRLLMMMCCCMALNRCVEYYPFCLWGPTTEACCIVMGQLSMAGVALLASSQAA